MLSHLSTFLEGVSIKVYVGNARITVFHRAPCVGAERGGFETARQWKKWK